MTKKYVKSYSIYLRARKMQIKIIVYPHIPIKLYKLKGLTTANIGKNEDKINSHLLL